MSVSQIGATRDGLFNFAVFLVFALLTVLVLDESLGVPPSSTSKMQQTSVVAAVSATGAELDPTSVEADLKALRYVREMLLQHLALITAKLQSAPNSTELAAQRVVIERILHNAGSTGIDDRISAYVAASQQRPGKLYSVEENIRAARAAADLHRAAISCRSGAIAKALKRLGLDTQPIASHQVNRGE
jgi:hypothetical protein